MRLLAALLLPSILPAVPLAAHSGLPSRESNTELIITTPPPPDLAEYGVQRVFAAINTFPGNAIPTVGEIPDGSGRLFAILYSGEILAFPNKPLDLQASEIQTMLNITPQVCRNIEAGMYDLAFDPDYLTNGRVYVSYVYNDGRCFQRNPGAPHRVSRFTVTNFETFEIDLASELVLLEIPQGSEIHKGGALRFGPDGMLYVSTGDAGFSSWGQNTTNLSGNILRIDVTSPPDPGLNYHIPTDNPFYNGGPAGTNTRKEIYAYGPRNPWKMSFHPDTGDLWVGDVGQAAYEEMNIIIPGGNYGWVAYEGFDCVSPSLCASLPIEQTALPITGYEHIAGIGNAINAGYIWKSTRLSELIGMHVFSDYGGFLGIIYEDGNGGYDWDYLTMPTPNTFAGMGSDFSGEVYITQGYLRPAEIYRIVRLDPSGTEPSESDLPNLLSEFPALHAAGSGQGHTIPGVIPYKPNAQLWSDGALKERYIAIPYDYPAAYAEEGAWAFPNSTVLVKNFLLPLDDRDPVGTAKRIETRVMYRYQNEWYGFSYAWNDAETDAGLLVGSSTREFSRIDKDGFPYQYSWYYPSRNDCRTCHTASSGEVLGISSALLNGPFTYPQTGITANQFDTLVSIGVIQPPVPTTSNDLPHRIPDYRDPAFELGDRVRAYFHANCAMCHRPNGPTLSTMDLRWYADDINAIGLDPLRDSLGLLDPQIIYPGNHFRSVLYERMVRFDGARMPPLATSVVDQEAVDMIRDWIIQMAPSSADGAWMDYH